MSITLGALLGLSASIMPGRAAETNDSSAALEQFLSKFKWVRGPSTATMQQVAQVDVPPGFMFTDGNATRTLLKSMGNLTSGTEVGFLAPTSLVWFVVFRFSEDGYVKDDDKDKLDATAMLKTIQRGSETANRERRRLGYPEMKIVGWEHPPAYDPKTQNLEWAIRAESEGGQVVNYNTRLLGRHGVMEVKLVVEPDQLASTLPEFKQLLTTYTYQPGQRYAEYRSGDKLAAYGLAALITGGAMAAAAKTGLLGWLLVFLKKGIKLIVVGCIAVVALFRRLIFGRTEATTADD